MRISSVVRHFTAGLEQGQWSRSRADWFALLASALVLSHSLAAQVRTGRPEATPGATADSVLAFKGVTVVDVDAGRLVPQQTVVIADRRIRAVGATGKVPVPKNARVVDAEGQYLIPGLWDMHVHVDASGNDDPALQDSIYRAAYPLFVAYGVTGIREMAQRFPHGADSFRVWQREVMAGTRVGPRAIGPSADLSGGNGIELGTPEDAVRIIDSLKSAGDAFAKFHATPDKPEIFFALAREARRVDLPLVGHLPQTTVTSADASDSGMRSIEHLEAFRGSKCWENRSGDTHLEYGRQGKFSDFDKHGGQIDAERCAALAPRLVRNGTAITPTLSMEYFLASIWTPRVDEFLGGAPPRPIRMDSLRARWSTDPAAQMKATVFETAFRAVGLLQQAGVTILAGTDASTTMAPLPGFMLHQELRLLVEVAGLTPLEALRAATLSPAKFLRATDSLGTIAAGKVADLVLLDANPLADIRNTETVRAVIANGRYFDRSALDTLRLQAEKAWPDPN